MPLLLMERLENVAMPETAATVVVPERVPADGFVPIATVTLAVEPGNPAVTTLLHASCTATCTAGLMAALKLVFVGWTVIASFAAALGLMLNAALVRTGSPAVVAVNVY